MLLWSSMVGCNFWIIWNIQILLCCIFSWSCLVCLISVLVTKIYLCIENLLWVTYSYFRLFYFEGESISYIAFTMVTSSTPILWQNKKLKCLFCIFSTFHHMCVIWDKFLTGIFNTGTVQTATVQVWCQLIILVLPSMGAASFSLYMVDRILQRKCLL